MEMNLNEKLHGRQKNIDKNRNGRIDAEDFKMLRGKKNNGEMGESRYVTSKGGRFDREEMPMSRQDMEMGMNNMPGFDLEEFCSHHHNMDTPECQSYYNHNSEVDEGNAFTGALANAKKHHKDEFNVDGKKFHVKESVKLTEAELIDLIENLVNEKEIKGLKNLAKPKGMAEYERAYKGSGRENKDAISATNKKMKEYVKYGSEGEYDSEPKDFPMSNGQIKHKDIKGFNMDNEGQEFIETYLQPGQENISFDEMHPNEEQIKNNIEGSSKTGNSDEYANSVKTGVNKKIFKKQKEHKLDILSKKAANKDPQPVFSAKGKKQGYSDGDGVRVTNESNNLKEERILNEEFSRITELMKYNRSTQ
jgi:hypothetical protein